MATIRKRSGRWQAIVKRKGYPLLSKTFDQKTDAEKWARKQERDIDLGDWIDTTEAQNCTFAQLLIRYSQEITPRKRGADVEQIRIRALLRSPLAKYSLAALTKEIIAQWRDQRLKQVSSSTVARDMQLLSHIFSVAIRDWSYGIRQNPCSFVRRPAQGVPRDRVLTTIERSKLLAACDDCRNLWIKPVVIFALETAARRGEILSLKWSEVVLERNTAKLNKTKSGKPRTIPLSPACVSMLQQLPRVDSGFVFPITAMALKLAFRRAVERAKIDHITFHDLRHDALTRLARLGLNILELRSISGHASTDMLQRYVSIDAEELAAKLGRDVFLHILSPIPNQKVDRNDGLDTAPC